MSVLKTVLCVSCRYAVPAVCRAARRAGARSSPGAQLSSRRKEREGERGGNGGRERRESVRFGQGSERRGERAPPPSPPPPPPPPELTLGGGSSPSAGASGGGVLGKPLTSGGGARQTPGLGGGAPSKERGLEEKENPHTGADLKLCGLRFLLLRLVLALSFWLSLCVFTLICD